MEWDALSGWPERSAMKALVIDDHPLVQEAVSNVLRRLEPHAVIDLAATCERGLELAGLGPEPDLVLLDLNLPGISGIPAVKLWRSRYPAVAVVVLSAANDQQTVLAAMGAGAAGFIPKSSSNEVMLNALRLVLGGGRYLPPELLSQASGSSAASRRSLQEKTSVESLGLSALQIEVL